jgi:GNAT superfamily N-acetyltransferase
MIYRLATKKDIFALAEMRWDFEYEFDKENFNFTKEQFLKSFVELLEIELNKNWFVWLVEDEKEIISNIFIRKIRKIPKPQKLFSEIAYITNVYTRKEYRNKGIGNQLLKNIKEWALKDKVELLFLWPSEESIKFYEREGFKKENEILELDLES